MKLSETEMDFAQYQQSIIRQFSSIHATSEQGEFDEQALSAYTNPNPVMRWLFWERVRVVVNYLENRPLRCVMDFGCGFGVMLPFLSARSELVVAVDSNIDLIDPVNRFQNPRVKYAKDLRGLLDVYEGELDVILAMDVLEHVADLVETLALFKKLLKPSGILLVSGPTENFWYKLGRTLAGYSGDYHIRNIYDIIRAMKTDFWTMPIATLIPSVPLFVVAAAVHTKDKSA